MTIPPGFAAWPVEEEKRPNIFHCNYCNQGQHATCEANMMPFCQCRRDDHMEEV